MKKCQFRDKESNSGQYAIRKPWEKPCGGYPTFSVDPQENVL